MAYKKNKNSGNGIALGVFFGVVFVAAYGIISRNIATGAGFGLAIGVLIGAIFDFVLYRYFDVGDNAGFFAFCNRFWLTILQFGRINGSQLAPRATISN